VRSIFLVAQHAAVLSFTLVAGCQHAERRHHPGADPALPFSNAVEVGDTVWIGGHLGLDARTRQAPADPADEVQLLLDAFEATLQRAGLGMDDLVSVTVHCTDLGLYDLFNTAYRERFRGPFPARAFLGAGPLLRGCRFEILGVAARR
jgi:2-iminobutanoate/2-iminopropanoate deaminase